MKNAESAHTSQPKLVREKSASLGKLYSSKGGTAITATTTLPGSYRKLKSEATPAAHKSTLQEGAMKSKRSSSVNNGQSLTPNHKSITPNFSSHIQPSSSTSSSSSYCSSKASAASSASSTRYRHKSVWKMSKGWLPNIITSKQPVSPSRKASNFKWDASQASRYMKIPKLYHVVTSWEASRKVGQWESVDHTHSQGRNYHEASEAIASSLKSRSLV